jgi:hypothetical protein
MDCGTWKNMHKSFIINKTLLIYNCPSYMEIKKKPHPLENAGYKNPTRQLPDNQAPKV